MLSDQFAISVRNLTKTYRLFEHPGDRVKQFFSFGLKRYHREYTALRDISFDVRKGETLGIIGRNGAGKSTLLQVVCGILKPTSGDVRINGNVSALLELGAGFNPEFTGRENVYFHAAITGRRREETDTCLDDILALADIGEFIDQPVRTYSSGMFVRLAFSVAIHALPDILVVDEALAVGDAPFQERCFRKIRELKDAGGTILLVSHALEQVAHHCDRAILLNKGNLDYCGTTETALAKYLLATRRITSTTLLPAGQKGTNPIDQISSHPAYNPDETRWGDGAAAIANIIISQCGRNNPARIVPGNTVTIQLDILFLADIAKPIYGFAIKLPSGAFVLNTNSRELPNAPPPSQRTGDRVSIFFLFDPIMEYGTYLLSFGVASDGGTGVVPHDRRYDVIAVEVAPTSCSLDQPPLNPRFHMTVLEND